MGALPLPIRKHLRRLKDPRINRRKLHLLSDIVTMAICAVIGNANTWKDVATFARRRNFAAFGRRRIGVMPPIAETVS